MAIFNILKARKFKDRVMRVRKFVEEDGETLDELLVIIERVSSTLSETSSQPFIMD